MADVPNLSSDEGQSEDEEWQEMEVNDSSVSCLFCTLVLPSLKEALTHCEEAHNFRLYILRLKFDMDCYSYIKLINFIKTHKPSAEVIVNAEKSLWEDEIYLKPVENDEWLMYDFESLTEQRDSPQTFHANVENGLVTLSQAHFTDLQKTIYSLTQQLKETQSYLNMAKEDMEKMKKSMKTLVEGDTTPSEGFIVNCVSKVALEDDEGYFNSYAHFSIHHEMLSDRVRTETYQKAILNNSLELKGKAILDLGCGTGILSMFAATAGAKVVYALDQSEIVFHAMDIIRENNLHEKIKVIKGRLENTKLEEKVDVIISEWMGYFLLFEGMLDSVIYARDNYLKPNGLLLPNRCNISLIANGDIETHKRLVDFWSDVYGFKMNCMKAEVVREASVDIVHSKYLLSSSCIIQDIDINTCTTDVMDFTAEFKLPILKDGSLTSLIGYFDTFFDLPNPIQFSTSPQEKPTHWKQTVFYFKDCIPVKAGEVVTGTIVCNRLKTDVRAMSVKLDLYGKQYRYLLS